MANNFKNYDQDNSNGNNVTRQTIFHDPRRPVDHINSGYEGDIPTDFTIPSCELEDVDKAVHRLFDKDIGFQVRKVSTTSKATGETAQVDIKKPFVLLATGERFALVKKLNPIRNTKGALILPAISIRRTNVEQTVDDITGRGLNQFAGDMIIKRKLESSDKFYQNFINKLGLANAQFPSSSRLQNEFGPQQFPGTNQGALLDSHLGNNIFEIVTVPLPQFWTQTYEIIFWTNYTQHMNYMIETLVSSFLPQGKMFKLNTDKGYWFIGYVDDTFDNQGNLDDFTEQDRIIKYSFTMKVKSYLLAANGPGQSYPVRKFVSAPFVSFDMSTADGQINSLDQLQAPPISSDLDQKFILSEIQPHKQLARTPTTNQKFRVSKQYIDPRTGQKITKDAKIVESNQKVGETIYTAKSVKDLEDFLALIE